MVKPERPEAFVTADEPVDDGALPPLPLPSLVVQRAPLPAPAVKTPLARPPVSVVQPPARKRKRGLFSVLRLPKWFWASIIVLLPTLLGGFYYLFVAADVYVSEARFIVRSTTHGQGGGVLGQLLQTTGFAKSEDDTFSVHDYIMSRDALKVLVDKHDLRRVYAHAESDFIGRFPNLMSDESFEALYKYYEGRVSIVFDHSTGISTIRVKAFTAPDAREIALALLSLGEDVVNRLNLRERQDAIDTAKTDVAFSEKRVIDARTRIAEFRQKETQLDPSRSSIITVEMIGKLEFELAGLRSKLTEILAASPNSPNVPSLRNGIAALEAQISSERIKSSSNVNATKLADYERLQIEREFADKAYASSTASLESARIDAQRRQLYLERIVLPGLPDIALLPNRLTSILTIFVSALLIYGVSMLFIAGVREHSEI